MDEEKDVLQVLPLKNMASGAKLCALVQNSEMRRHTGFGKTRKEAIADARSKLNRPHKK